MAVLARAKGLALPHVSKGSLAWACAGAILVWAGFRLSPSLYWRLTVCALAGTAGIVAAALQMKRGLIGLLVLVVTAVAFPWEGESSGRAPLNTSLPLAAVIMTFWLLSIVAFRRYTLPGGRAVNALLAFLGISVLAFATTQFPAATATNAPMGAQLAGLALPLISGALMLAAADMIRDVGDLRRVTWVFVVAGAVAAVTQTFPGLGLIGRWVVPGSVGSLFWTWFAAICFSQGLANRQLSCVTRLALLVLTALTLYRGLFVARSWASGWIPVLVACGVVLFFQFPRLTLTFALIAGPLFFAYGGQMVAAENDAEQYSTMTRLEAWKTLWPLIKASPLLGLGPSNYYYQTLAAPILGWYVSFNSHNQYMDVLAQSGFLGLLAFLWFLFEISRTALGLLPQMAEGFSKAYVIGAFAGIAGTIVSGMLADWVIPFYYNIGLRGFRSSLLFWVFGGGLLALDRIGTFDRGEARQALGTTGTPVLD